MESVKIIKFNAEIVREYSFTPVLENLGKAECSMELFTEDGTIQKNGYANIEWIVEYVTDESDDIEAMDVEHIGIWFENRRLTEYDGVFSLPKQAVRLLRTVGITVPREFEK